MAWVVAGAVVVGAGAVVDAAGALVGDPLDAAASAGVAESAGIVVSNFPRRVVDVDVDESATTATELAVELLVIPVSVLERPKMKAPTATVTTTAPTSKVVMAWSTGLRRRRGGASSTTGVSPVGSSQLAIRARYPPGLCANR